MQVRNIEKLIEAIKAKTPEDWVGKFMFFAALDNVIVSSYYRAPEAYNVNFDQLAMVLNDHLGVPDISWKEEIADIFADKTKVEGMEYYQV